MFRLSWGCECGSVRDNLIELSLMTCGRSHKWWARGSMVSSSEWIALLIWIWMAGRKIFEEVKRRARLIFLFYFRKKNHPNKWSFFKPSNNVANERCILAGFGKDKFLTISHLGGDLLSKGSKTTHERGWPASPRRRARRFYLSPSNSELKDAVPKSFVKSHTQIACPGSLINHRSV